MVEPLGSQFPLAGLSARFASSIATSPGRHGFINGPIPLRTGAGVFKKQRIRAHTGQTFIILEATGMGVPVGGIPGLLWSIP
jgi:hypothetical protein